MTALRFTLERDRDLTGISGTGTVADGVLWPDGSATIRWRGEHPSVVHWRDLDDAEAIHGHDGATRFVMLDPGPARGWRCPNCGTAARVPAV